MSIRSREIVAGAILDERYRVLGVIGYGGFSTVYEAVHLQIDRKVAIKVLDAGLEVEASETALTRFLNEARAAARVDHPNVVTVYDVGLTTGSRPYIVMQLFEGETLHKHLFYHGGMSPATLLPLFIRCLDGLAVAHEAGLVHRDLKPQNLVLTDPGTAIEALKIIDFGTVQLLNERANLTAAGHIIGTMAYLPPEYLRRKEVSSAMDVYQMGLVLVEALTGRRLVHAETPLEYAQVHGAGQLNIPEALRSSPLGPVLDKALAVNAQDRYPNAGAFLAALHQVDPAQVPGVAQPPKGKLVSGGVTHSEELVVTRLQTVALDTADLQIVGGVHDKTTMNVALETRPEPATTENITAPTPIRGQGSQSALLMVGVTGGVVALLIAGLLLLLFQGAQTPGQTPTAPTKRQATPPVEISQTLVRIEAVPNNAAILVGGTHLGTGQATLLFVGEDRQARSVEIKAPGHVSQIVSVTPDAGEQLRVTLSKVREVEAPKAAPPAPPSSPKAAATESSSTAKAAPVKPAAKPPLANPPGKASAAPRTSPHPAPTPKARPKKKTTTWEIIE